MQKETQRCISKANKDLTTAGFALQSIDGPLPVTTALHCQKAAENYLKAFLHEQQRAFTNQHSLTVLFESCHSIDNSFEALRNEISRLEGYSVAFRYPKASESLKFRKEALATAERVKQFVISRLT